MYSLRPNKTYAIDQVERLKYDSNIQKTFQSPKNLERDFACSKPEKMEKASALNKGQIKKLYFLYFEIP